VLLIAVLRLDVLTGRHLLGAWADRRRHGKLWMERDGGERGDNGDENAGRMTWAGRIYWRPESRSTRAALAGHRNFSTVA
jgi:hypothetical protein